VSFHFTHTYRSASRVSTFDSFFAPKEYKRKESKTISQIQLCALHRLKVCCVRAKVSGRVLFITSIMIHIDKILKTGKKR